MHGDQAAVHRPGADRYVAGLQRVNKFSGFLNWRGEVGIGEKRDAAARFLHAVAHAVAFAAVDTIRNHPKRGNLDAKILRHGRGAIFRAVVHHQHFRFPAGARKIRCNPLQCGRKAQFLIVRGDDDGEVGSRWAHRQKVSCQPWYPTSGTNRQPSSIFVGKASPRFSISCNS